MRALLVSIYMIPVFAVAAPSVMVDAIPSGAILFNYSTVQIPIRDLEKADAKEVEAGLASSISRTIPYAEQNSVSYICILSAPGDDFRSFMIDAIHAKLTLPTKNASFMIVLYRAGGDSPKHPTYSIDRPDSNKKKVSVRIKKVAVPEGWSTVAWIYFNLPRIQDAASRAGASQIFLETTGTGATAPIFIPGLKKPLMVFTDQAEISASWYVTKDEEPSMQKKLLQPTPIDSTK